MRKAKKRKGITGKDRNKRRMDHDDSGAYLPGGSGSLPYTSYVLAESP